MCCQSRLPDRSSLPPAVTPSVALPERSAPPTMDQWLPSAGHVGHPGLPPPGRDSGGTRRDVRTMLDRPSARRKRVDLTQRSSTTLLLRDRMAPRRSQVATPMVCVVAENKPGDVHLWSSVLAGVAASAHRQPTREGTLATAAIRWRCDCAASQLIGSNMQTVPPGLTRVSACATNLSLRRLARRQGRHHAMPACPAGPPWR